MNNDLQAVITGALQHLGNNTATKKEALTEFLEGIQAALKTLGLVYDERAKTIEKAAGPQNPSIRWSQPTPAYLRGIMLTARTAQRHKAVTPELLRLTEKLRAKL